MSLKYDFSGWATRNDLVCADGRTIRHNAFEDCDGKTVPLVWNHQHDEPGNILGHALLENRKDGVYAYCTFNDTESGKAAKALVQHGDIASLSIYANGLKQTRTKDVMHGVIREVSLVVAGANPGAFIDFVDMAHGEGGEQEMILSAYEPISLYRPDEKPPLIHKADDKTEPEDDKKEDKSKDDGKEEKPKDEKTVQDVVDSMTEEQKTVMYALIGAAMEELDSSEGGEDDEDDPDKKSDNTKGGNKTMKHNVFEQEETQDNVLSHSDRKAILDLAKTNSVGSLRTALNIYAEQNELKHGIDNIETLFPEFKDLRPGAPERVTRDQGWVTVVMQKVHKSPISRIRTRQADARNSQLETELRAFGYKKGTQKQNIGNIKLVSRTTDPQTVYVKDYMNRDDKIDITDFDVVAYIQKIMRNTLNEELATAIMIGDRRDDGDPQKIAADKIRPIWGDDALYVIYSDVDKEAMKTQLQGTDTATYFGDNFIQAEAIIESALYAREQYRGSGSMDFYCDPHLVNIMLLARDRNGHRLYKDINDLKAALNVQEIVTVEQFANKTRTASGKKKKLLGIFVNLADYQLGATKGGEVTTFSDFNIDFNQEQYLIETRVSGALTRVKSAIVLEEDVTETGA